MRLSKSDETTVPTNIGSSVLQAVGLRRGGQDDEGATETGPGTAGAVAESEAIEATDSVRQAATADVAATEAGLPLDQVFEILKNRRRREVLHYLNDHDGSASLSDLAEHIAAMENDTTVDAISSSQRKRVYVGLYQCHLPKMDDMDIVAFDQNRGDVELSSNAQQLETYLRDDRPTVRWHRFYAAAAAGGGLLLGLSEIGGAGYGLSIPLVLAVLILTVAGGAAYQTYQLELVEDG